MCSLPCDLSGYNVVLSLDAQTSFSTVNNDATAHFFAAVCSPVFCVPGVNRDLLSLDNVLGRRVLDSALASYREPGLGARGATAPPERDIVSKNVSSSSWPVTLCLGEYSAATEFQKELRYLS